MTKIEPSALQQRTEGLPVKKKQRVIEIYHKIENRSKLNTAGIVNEILERWKEGPDYPYHNKSTKEKSIKGQIKRYLKDGNLIK